jgi:hypothetical protein
MIVGLGDDSAPPALGPDESCCSPEKRKQKALKHLGRAHRKGALAAVAAGDVQLGDLGEVEAGDLWPNPTEVDAEEAAFDGRLNAWQVDYQAAYAALPKALTQQIDSFLARWQSRPTFWVFSATHLKLIIDAEAEFNRYRDQVAAMGHPSSVQAATVSVDGTQVRADQIPPGSSTLDRIETIVKWGGIIVGGVALYKIASTLGLVGQLSRLVGGGGSGGGVRRYGSARKQ